MFSGFRILLLYPFRLINSFQRVCFRIAWFLVMVAVTFLLPLLTVGPFWFVNGGFCLCFLFLPFFLLIKCRDIFIGSFLWFFCRLFFVYLILTLSPDKRLARLLPPFVCLCIPSFVLLSTLVSPLIFKPMAFGVCVEIGHANKEVALLRLMSLPPCFWLKCWKTAGGLLRLCLIQRLLMWLRQH